MTDVPDKAEAKAKADEAPAAEEERPVEEYFLVSLERGEPVAGEVPLAPTEMPTYEEATAYGTSQLRSPSGFGSFAVAKRYRLAAEE